MAKARIPRQSIFRTVVLSISIIASALACNLGLTACAKNTAANTSDSNTGPSHQGSGWRLEYVTTLPGGAMHTLVVTNEDMSRTRLEYTPSGTGNRPHQTAFLEPDTVTICTEGQGACEVINDGGSSSGGMRDELPRFVDPFRSDLAEQVGRKRSTRTVSGIPSECIGGGVPPHNKNVLCRAIDGHFLTDEEILGAVVLRVVHVESRFDSSLLYPPAN